jgi:hypothetical protein
MDMSGSSGTPWDSPDRKRLEFLERVEEFMKAGRFAVAVRLTESALREFPGDRALKAAREIALVTEGVPGAAGSGIRALATRRMEPSTLGTAAVCLHEGAERTARESATRRLRAIHAAVRLQALERMGELVQALEAELRRAEPSTRELGRLQAVERSLAKCFSDPQCPPPWRAAAGSARVAVDNALRCRRAGRLCWIADAVVAMAATALVAWTSAGSPGFLGVATIVALQVLLCEAYRVMAGARERSRREARKALAAADSDLRAVRPHGA